MIPKAHIIAWKDKAPWPDETHVEQDLILSRSLVDIFSDPLLSQEFAFRGGTALHKLFVQPPARYSEDIDLVQINAQPIGHSINLLRSKLDPWLGKPTYKQGQGRFTLYYRFIAETEAETPMRVKVEINTREHFSVYPLQKREFFVENPWFTGNALINIYALEELIGTKLRALYQRKKGRDLFDLAIILHHYPSLDIDKIIHAFQQYMSFVGKTMSRSEFEVNLDDKCSDPAFRYDIQPLISTQIQEIFDLDRAACLIKDNFLKRL